MNNDFVDLRSDTVTKPTPEMREAMAEAEVGDDVYGDDLTVNKLQEKAAEMLGKEAALFVPSGTMGNLLAILVHCARGEEVICGDKSHIYVNEAGGMAALGGIFPHPISNQKDGTLRLEDIRAAIQPDDSHRTITRLVCIENTQNICGGVVLSVDYTQQVGQLAKENGLKFHIDGARIFNALVVTGDGPAEWGRRFHTISVCLSKGLGAPVGSVLVGSMEHITEARRVRKRLGGGMRQAGMLAAACLYALDEHIDRLALDHQRAQRLAEALMAQPYIASIMPVTTNIIILTLAGHRTASSFLEQLRSQGIIAAAFGPQMVRMVTHLDVDDAAIDRTIHILDQLA